jgi:2-dehydro-3-deoxyphosphogluconate aldolase / (4S)-4-hydroxy-2-oxoglutarate aldolase
MEICKHLNLKEKKMQKTITRFIQHPHKILPIIEIDDADAIVPTIEALIAGGIYAVEITLRNKAGYAAMTIARKKFPELYICAGTVTSVEQIEKLKDTGIDFIISPGTNISLLQACQKNKLDTLTGVCTPSDILLGMEFGLSYFKFFPAHLMGGTTMLRAWEGPFSQIQFCATGGINENNFMGYISLNNVFCIGSSWIASKTDIAQKNWQGITQKAIYATQQICGKN